MLPPLLITVGKGLSQKLQVAGLVGALKEAWDLRAYLSNTRPDEAAGEREARVRTMYDALLARLELDDVPPEAFQPIVDHLVTKTLAEWDAESLDRPGQIAPPRHSDFWLLAIGFVLMVGATTGAAGKYALLLLLPGLLLMAVATYRLNPGMASGPRIFLAAFTAMAAICPAGVLGAVTQAEVLHP